MKTVTFRAWATIGPSGEVVMDSTALADGIPTVRVVRPDAATVARDGGKRAIPVLVTITAAKRAKRVRR